MELKNSIVYHMERELWNFKLVFLILMIVLFWLMNSMGAILSALKGAFSRYIYQYYGHLVSRSKLLYSGAGLWLSQMHRPSMRPRGLSIKRYWTIIRRCRPQEFPFLWLCADLSS